MITGVQDTLPSRELVSHDRYLSVCIYMYSFIQQTSRETATTFTHFIDPIVKPFVCFLLMDEPPVVAV